MQHGTFLNKDMKKIMLKMRILRMIDKENIYSYAIVKKFAERPHSGRLFSSKRATKNEVYNTISALEKSGYIKQAGKSKSARAQNYYKTTSKGKSALASARKVFISSMKEVSHIFR